MRPANIAKELDYFRIEPYGDIKDEFQVERDLSKAEAQFAQMISEVIKHKCLPPSGSTQLSILLGNIARIIATTPKIKAMIQRKFGEYISDKVAERTCTEDAYNKLIEETGSQDLVNKISYQQFREFILNEDRYTFKIDNTSVIYYQLRQIQTIAAVLERKKWSLSVAAGEDECFITCDNPLTYMLSSHTPPGRYPPKSLEGLVDIALGFPLTSKLMMVGDHPNSSLANPHRTRRELVAISNSLNIVQTTRHAFLPDEKILLMTATGISRLTFSKGECEHSITQAQLDEYASRRGGGQ